MALNTIVVDIYCHILSKISISCEVLVKNCPGMLQLENTICYITVFSDG